MNSRIIRLINSYERTRFRSQRQLIELSAKDAYKLRKGVPYNRTIQGEDQTILGSTKWMVINVGYRYYPNGRTKFLRREGDYYELFYGEELTPSWINVSAYPNSSLTFHEDYEKARAKAIDFLIETVGGAKIEFHPTTEKGREKVLKHWKEMKKKPAVSRKKKKEEGTTTYTLTAYRYHQHYTPAPKMEETVWHKGKNCTYWLETEEVMHLETACAQTLGELRKQIKDSYHQDLITAYRVTSGETEYYYQYKTLKDYGPRPNAEENNGWDLYEWEKKQKSTERKWQQVEKIDTDRLAIERSNK